VVGLTRVQQLCQLNGHFKPLMTPPYHPELQPFEKLWRDVKMFVARKFTGTRNMLELKLRILEVFAKYGTAEACVGKMKEARDWAKKYMEEGDYVEVIDLTLLDDDTDDEREKIESDCESDSDCESVRL